MAASQTQGGGDGGGDCYYLLMRDRERTLRMVQQLVDTLQQVAWSLYLAAVTKACQQISRRYTNENGGLFIMFSCPQAVRATPIPVTWMTREEDSLLSGQVGRE